MIHFFMGVCIGIMFRASAKGIATDEEWQAAMSIGMSATSGVLFLMAFFINAVLV